MLIYVYQPFFFNTVYDPYRGGSDFVRGFPYSLRAGVATAVSHGLWLYNYDYDAPTQLLKVWWEGGGCCFFFLSFFKIDILCVTSICTYIFCIIIKHKTGG
jgi:hypothetical protein